VFEIDSLVLPDSPLPLIEKDYHLRSGVEIGWLGFPAVQRSTLCFFSGRVSAYLEGDHAYLVDGVAINGVSGGPAFRLGLGRPELIGVVSAYIPNRATGDTLPGLAVVRDVQRFHDLAAQFKTIDEARAEQSPPGETPPPPIEGETSTRVT
jgi:hypothetical protein